MIILAEMYVRYLFLQLVSQPTIFGNDASSAVLRLQQTMPSDVSQSITIYQEWVSSLVGMWMRVPAHWWAGCSGNDESPG